MRQIRSTKTELVARAIVTSGNDSKYTLIGFAAQSHGNTAACNIDLSMSDAKVHDALSSLVIHATLAHRWVDWQILAQDPLWQPLDRLERIVDAMHAHEQMIQKWQSKNGEIDSFLLYVRAVCESYGIGVVWLYSDAAEHTRQISVRKLISILEQEEINAESN